MKDVSAAVFTVAHQLRKAKQRRKALLEQEQIKELTIRVNNALEHGGFDTITEATNEISTDGFLFAWQSAKRKERKNILDRITLCETLSKTQNDIFVDIDTWLFTLKEDFRKICQSEIPDEIFPDEEANETSELLRRANDVLAKINLVFQKKYKKSSNEKEEVIKTKPEKHKEEVMKTEAEDKSSTDIILEEKLKISKKVYHEKDLEDMSNIKQAVKTISTLLEDGKKHASSLQAKSNFKVCLKQMQVLGTLLERKYEYSTELDEKNKKLSNEITNLKYLEQQRKSDLQQMKVLADEKEQLTQRVKDLEKRIDEITKRPSFFKYQESHHTERRVSILLPHETEPPAQIRVESQDEKSVTSVKDSFRAGGESKRSMVSRSYLQSSLDTELDYSTRTLSSPGTPIALTSEFFTKEEIKEKFEGDSKSVHSVKDLIKAEDQSQLEELKRQISYHKGMLKNTEDKIAEQQKEIERLSYENTERQFTSLATPKPSVMKSIKSLNKLADQRIDRLEMQIKKMRKEINDKNYEMTEEKKKNEQLRLDLQRIMSEKEKLEMRLKKDVSVNLETPDISRDQLLKKIKKESEKEVQQLRSYILSEEERHQATIRRINADHKNYISRIRNDTTQIMLLLNRFKFTIMSLLQDEDTKALEQPEIIDIESLLLYEDGKGEILIQESALSIIRFLEKSLKTVMLEKRLMIKHSDSYKQNIEQELAKCKIRLENIMQAFDEQEHLTKRANERNETLTKQYNELVVTNNILQREIGPCRELLDKYNSLQNEITRMRSEEKVYGQQTKEIIKEFENDRNRLKRELNKLNFAQICQQDFTESLIKGRTCQQKVQIIDNALHKNQITTKNHEKATEILEHTKDITYEQLASFLERYITLRKNKSFLEYMKKLGMKYQEEKRFQKYYDIVQAREEAMNEKWRVKKNKLKEEKEEAFRLLMILLRNDKDEDLGVKAKSLIPDREISELKKKAKRKLELKRSIPKYPSEVKEVIGKKINSSKVGGSYWQMPPIVPPHLVQITTPRILEMDIEKGLRITSKTKNQKRKLFFPAISSFCDLTSQTLH